MKNVKTDRRIKYTKKVLKDSLVELLQEKPITKVSIKEICENADINRSTFYAHYSDQYDLLLQIKQEVLQDLNNYLDDYNFKEYEAESFQTIERIFEYIIDNAQLCKVLMGDNGAGQLQYSLMMIIERHMKEWQSNKEMDEETMEYMYLFAVSGVIGIVQKWFESGMRMNAREMAELVTRLTYRGLAAFV